MSNNKKKYILNTVSVNLGCNSCKKPRLFLSSILHPKPKHKLHHHHSSSSSSSNTTSTTATTTPTTFSSSFDDQESSDVDIKSLRAVQGFGRIGGQSMAVEKDSDDPYLDFRHSMLQMILEKDIYTKDDLKELLNCFLQLNSPYYHGIIVQAFTEIWNGVCSDRAAAESPDLWS